MEITIEQIRKDREQAVVLQTLLIKKGILDPVADGSVGLYTTHAFFEWTGGSPRMTESRYNALPIPNNPPTGNTLVCKVAREMMNLGYFVARGKDLYNIFYLEGMRKDGVLGDAFNYWNDLRGLFVWPLEDENPTLIGLWDASSEPGLVSRPNPKGTAMIKLPSQHKAWAVGVHKRGTRTAHEALVQVKPVTYLRSKHRPPLRTKAFEETGIIGLNQHHGWNAPRVGNNSAGCLVGKSVNEHEKFMSILKKDVRYKLNNSYIFITTCLDAASLD